MSEVNKDSFERRIMADNKSSLIELIDERNQYSKEHYDDVMVDSISQDAYIDETLKMAQKASYNVGIFKAKINKILHTITLGKDVDLFDMIADIGRQLTKDDMEAEHHLLYYRVVSMYYIEVEGNYDLGLEYGKKALAIAEDIGDKNAITSVKNNIAVINDNLGMYEAALEGFLECLDYLKTINNDVQTMYGYNNVAYAYMHLDVYDLAESNFLKVIEYLETNELILLKHDVYIGLAEVYRRQSRVDQSISILENLYHEMLETDSPRFVVETVIKLSEIYMEMYEWDKVYNLLKKHENLLEEVERIQLSTSYYDLLATVYDHKKEYEKAFQALKSHVELYKQNSDIETQKNLSRMMNKENQKRLEKFELIASIGRELTIQSDMDSLLLEVERLISGFMKIDAIGLGYLKKDRIHFDHFYYDGIKLDPLSYPIDNADTIAGWVLRNEKEVIINNFESEYKSYIKKPIIVSSGDNQDVTKSMMYMPLFVKSEMLGIFTIQCYEESAYSAEDMEVFRIIGSYVAIGAKNIQQAKVLEKLSHTDPLTSLNNRRSFIERFRSNIKDNKEFGKSLAMIMMDLDHFKKVNDSYGHPIGDEVLVTIGKTILAYFGNSGDVCRFGGEEFAVLLYDHDYQEVVDLCEGLRKEVAGLQVSKKVTDLAVTISIGFCFTNEMSQLKDFNQIYRLSDKALYQAKEDGRNRLLGIKI